jgi:hypothetical protein
VANPSADFSAIVATIVQNERLPARFFRTRFFSTDKKKAPARGRGDPCAKPVPV